MKNGVLFTAAVLKSELSGRLSSSSGQEKKPPQNAHSSQVTRGGLTSAPLPRSLLHMRYTTARSFQVHLLGMVSGRKQTLGCDSVH